MKPITISESLKSQIYEIHTFGKREDMNSLYARIATERVRISKFMDMFLEEFDEKLEAGDAKLQSLYDKKFEEYQLATQLLKTMEYYMKGQ